ncbi:MAG: winged helix-turn-helix transcriptional regulator [Thermoplasmata archaeon]
MGLKGENTQNREVCPIVEAIREVGNEWSLIIVRYLSTRAMGFNELLRSANSISPRTLSQNLKKLEEKGILHRNVINTRPFKVQYELTEKGRDLSKVLSDLKEWGNRWIINRPEAGYQEVR